MSDIVERLNMIRGTQFTPIEDAMVAEAADTITDLRTEVAQMQDAVNDSQSTLLAIKADCAARVEMEEDQMAEHIVNLCTETMLSNRAALTQTKDTTDDA